MVFTSGEWDKKYEENFLENFVIGNSRILIQEVRKANLRPKAQKSLENTTGLLYFLILST